MGSRCLPRANRWTGAPRVSLCAGPTARWTRSPQWLPNPATEPHPDQTDLFFAIFDGYAENPRDFAFWQFYDKIRESTPSHEPLPTSRNQRAFAWMQTKYEAIQVMGHMLRQRTLQAPDTAIDQPDAGDEAALATSIACNPFWCVGDLIRQRSSRRRAYFDRETLCRNRDHAEKCYRTPRATSYRRPLRLPSRRRRPNRLTEPAVPAAQREQKAS